VGRLTNNKGVNKEKEEGANKQLEVATKAL
jgi:hypothetical protein